MQNSLNNNGKMTAAQLQDLLMGGAWVMVGEYRQFSPETTQARDKKTGQVRYFKVLRSTIETGKDSVPVTEFVSEETDMSKVAAPASKGDKVVVVFARANTDKGQRSVSGQVYQLVK